jgi:membrane protease YdiL (CAAX protease family)
MQVPLVVVDPNTDVIVSSNRAAETLGIGAGSRFADLVWPNERARAYYERMQVASPEPRRACGLPVWRTRRRGTSGLARQRAKGMLPQVNWIAPIGWYHMLIFAVFVPLLAIHSRKKATASNWPPLDRKKHFRSTSNILVLFAALSLLTARKQRIDVFRLGATTSAAAIAAALAMYVVAVAAMRPRWRRAVEKRTRVVHLFMPNSPVERAWWIALSILAGISEEITWRGVQPALLAAALGSPLAGVIVAALTFGIGHMIQGWRSALLIGVFALGFQTLVWLSGSLYLAMLVHLAYDITAGLTYGRLGRELGYTLEAPASPPAQAAPL